MHILLYTCAVTSLTVVFAEALSSKTYNTTEAYNIALIPWLLLHVLWWLAWFYRFLFISYVTLLVERDRRTLLKKCLRRQRLSAYRDSRRKMVRGFCWLPLFPDVPAPVAFTIGGYLRLRADKVFPDGQFNTLLRLYGNSRYYGLVSRFTHVKTTHLCPGARSRFLFKTARCIGVDPQAVIDTAISTNSSRFGEAKAGQMFDNAFKNSIQVTTALTRSQRATVERMVQHPLIFTNQVATVTDHSELRACREIARTVFDRLYGVRNTKRPTLCVGAGRFESMYLNNPAIDHYYHMSEGKDYERVTGWILDEIAKAICSKAKTHSRLRKKKGEAHERLEIKTLDNVLKVYKKEGAIASNFYTSLPKEKYEALVFHDSHYNFSSEDWYNIFRATDAKVAYCNSLLPLDLVYPDMPPNDLYTLSFNAVTGNASFYYGVGGHSNGYTHTRDTWALPLDRPVLNFPKFSLMFEIDARAGPMAVFKVVRVDGPTVEAVARSVNLPKNLQFVRCMDPFESCKEDGTVQPKYFSVFANEFWETVNYALALDPKSMSFANLLAFVRRRGGGISLVNKELVAPWNLRQSRYASFCMNVFLFVRRQQASVDRISEFSEFQLTSTFSQRVSSMIWRLNPARYIRALLSDPLVLDQLVLFPEDSQLQRDYIKVLLNPGKPTHRVVVGTTDVEAHACDICAAYLPKRGKQVIRCCEGNKSVNIRVDTEELNALRMKWKDTDNDAAGLKKVKEEAAMALPLVGFEHTVDMFYIMGGPGCGKSHFIRAVATKLDGVALPFTKLVPDYQNLLDADGTPYNLTAKTFHRAIRDLRGCDRLFIDEFTALPWEVMQCIIYLSGAKEVFIVGDTKQTHVQPDEGKYIGDHVDIDKLPRHELLRNFRNPKDSVAMLNKIYDYDMQAMSEIEQSIFIYGPGDTLPTELGEQVAFSHDTCSARNLDGANGKDRTVRTYQGSTIRDHPLTLWIDDADLPLLASSQLSIVALSRHVQRINIVHQGQDVALDWLDGLDLPHSRTSLDAGLLPTVTPVHNQETAPLPVDDEEIGKVFTDLAPSGTRKTRPGFNISYSFILSVSVAIYKYLFGNIFVNQFGYVWAILKFSYLNRLFLVHRLGWSEWFAVLPYTFAKSVAIQYTVTTFLLPLRILFPALSLFIQRRRPGVPQPPYELRFLNFIIFKFFGLDFMPWYFRVSHQFWDGLFHYLFLLPQPVADTITYLTPVLTPVNCFCDTIEPFVMQLVVAWFFRKRVFLQEDVLFRIELPSFDDNGKYHDLINGFAISERFDKFRDWALTYIPSSLRKWQKLPEITEKLIKLPANISPQNAYLYAKDCLPAWADCRTGLEYPNILAPAVFAAQFRTGVMNVIDFLRPTNARGHPKKFLVKARTFGVVAGHRFTPRQPTQIFQVLAARYFNKKPACGADVLPGEAAVVLRDIAFHARQELLEEYASGWDDDTLDILANEFFKTAEVKHYAAQHVGEDNPNGRNIQFHLKAIFKPSLSDQKPMDVFKAGQGVSAWNKDGQILFGLCAKWINFVILQSLKRNVVYDNRMTEQKLRQRLRENWDTVDHTAKNGVTDFKMFDAQQDGFSQMLEKEFLKMIGVSSEFIDHYYSMRKNQTLTTTGFFGRLDTEKPSGEPLTLTGNSILSMLLANWLLRGEGPFIMAFKGDDGFKRQCNLHVDSERVAKLARVCRLQIKAYCEETAEFCGYAIGARSFCPSVPRKLAKAMGHEFKDYAHFCEYRQSLLDWLKDFDSQDTSDIVATNCDLFNLTVSECESMIEVIRSVAHLNEDQFLQQTMDADDPEVLKDGDTHAKF